MINPTPKSELCVKICLYSSNKVHYILINCVYKSVISQETRRYQINIGPINVYLLLINSMYNKTCLSVKVISLLLPYDNFICSFHEAFICLMQIRIKKVVPVINDQNVYFFYLKGNSKLVISLISIQYRL